MLECDVANHHPGRLSYHRSEMSDSSLDEFTGRLADDYIAD
jgi:hypothetical protein